MPRKRLLIVILLGLVLISSFVAVQVWSPALRAEGACRRVMARTEGYGPWRAQATNLQDTVQGTNATAAFFDGYNTATCHARRYGPIWIVVGMEQTLVGCSRALSASGGQECPRGIYGVIP